MSSQSVISVGEQAARRLIQAAASIPGLRVEAGLTDAELDAVQARFGFAFAPDHRAFLATALPVGPRWPDWRAGDDTDLRRRLAWPVEGTLFDVEHSQVWIDEWGTRPASTAEAVTRAREHLATVPQLVPVYSHRYLPAGPTGAGHPVLSVHQTDIIYYGTDLVDYLHQEFGIGEGISRTDPRWRPRASVAFWRDLI